MRGSERARHARAAASGASNRHPVWCVLRLGVAVTRAPHYPCPWRAVATVASQGDMTQGERRLFDREVWTSALEKFAGVTHLTGTLFDADGPSPRGPIHPPPLLE